MNSQEENRKKDAASDRAASGEAKSETPEKPSQAEGDRETIDEDIEEKEAEGKL